MTHELFRHVPLKRHQWDWDWRLRLNDTPHAIGCNIWLTNSFGTFRWKDTNEIEIGDWDWMTHLLNLVCYSLLHCNRRLRLNDTSIAFDAISCSEPTFEHKRVSSVSWFLYSLSKELCIPCEKSPIFPIYVLPCQKSPKSPVQRALHSWSKEPHKSDFWKRESELSITILIFTVKRALQSLSKEPYTAIQKSPTFLIKRALHSLSKEPYIPFHKSPTIPFKRAQHSISK